MSDSGESVGTRSRSEVLGNAAVIQIDVDGLPTAAGLGADRGDDLLDRMFSRLSGTVRDGDVLCHTRRDQFTIICTSSDHDGVERLADRVSHVLAEQVAHDRSAAPDEPVLTTSVTVSHGHSATTAVATADLGDAVLSGDMLEALRRDRHRTMAIVRHSTIAVVLFEADGTIVWVSPGCERLFDIEPDSLIGISGYDRINPDDIVRVEPLFRDLSPGEHARAEFRLTDASGRERWVEITGTNLLEDPDVGYVVGNLRDITERKRSDEVRALQTGLLGAVRQSVISTDLKGLVSYWNHGAELLFGWTSDEAMGQAIREMTVPEDVDHDGHEIMATLAKGDNWSGDVWLQRRDGSRFFAHVSDSPIMDADGNLIGIIGVTTDITERLELAQSAEEDRRRLENAQRNAKLGSFELRLPGRQLVWSEELFRILGIPEDSVPTRELYEQHTHPDDLTALRAITDSALEGGSDHELVHRIIRADGELRWVLIRSCPSSESDGLALSGTVLDVTERHAAEEQLEHQADHDALSGLPNRARLTRRIDELLEARERTGRPVTVAFLDLDRFKVINDGLGHATGDRVLLAVAERLLETVERPSMVGRFGGDEFVVVCDKYDQPDVALAEAERVGAALEAPFELDGRKFFLSASIGVAISGPDDDSASLLQSADAAMYDAKKRLGQRACYFDHRLRSLTRQRLELESELRQALSRDELSLLYQPIVRMSDGVTVGFESLLRWNHPTFRQVSPAEFIPIAEETGLIVPMGEWVLRESLERLDDWHGRPGLEHLWIGVNLSANQLAADDLVGRVRTALAESQVAPESLHLEITESVLMDRIEGSLEVLSALRSLGVHLSVDDFGTGYSSLSYLKRLPVQLLKIDRSFIDGLGADPHDTSIVRAITAMAEALSLEILAEGVENQQQHSELMALGCTLAQGYLWSAPLSADEALDWLVRDPAEPVQPSVV